MCNSVPTHDGAATGGFPALGLLANPFQLPDTDSVDAVGVRVAVRVAELRLLAALEAAKSDPDRKPIMVEKGEVPASYHVAALSGIFSALGAGEPVPGILQAYVPVDMMRMGRVRSVLSIVAERTASQSVVGVLASQARLALSEPDETLPEWVALGGEDIAGLISEIDTDPVAFATRVFGEPVDARDGADDTELLMRMATARTGRLEADPETAEPLAADLGEEATDDPMADAFVVPLGDVDETALAESTSQETLVADYVIAYLRAHVSPVVARGVLAYRAQGLTSMAQELKVTKAPTKTLAALLGFEGSDLGAIVYDRFDIWPSVPEDLRMKIIATLSQLRWALKDNAILVLLVTPGSAPELEESFAAARRVPWSFSEIEKVFELDSPYDRDIVRDWLAGAALDGVAPAWVDPVLAAVPDGAALAPVVAALGAILDAAAGSGTVPGPEVFLTALATATEGPAA